jgi:coiled-coil domain-containing protein 55
MLCGRPASGYVIAQMKLSFALPSTKSQPVGAAPSLKRPAAFSSLDEEEPIDAAPTLSDDRKVAATANKQLLAHNVGSMSKAMRKRIEEEKKVDETVYEYDEVWDKMQEAKLRQKEAKEVDALKRKVRLTSSCLMVVLTGALLHSAKIH